MLGFEDWNEIVRKVPGARYLIAVRVNSVILCNVKGHAPITLPPRLLNSKTICANVNVIEPVYLINNTSIVAMHNVHFVVPHRDRKRILSVVLAFSAHPASDRSLVGLIAYQCVPT